MEIIKGIIGFISLLIVIFLLLVDYYALWDDCKKKDCPPHH